MAGLLLLFLVMEEVCDLGPGTHVALFSDNPPTVHWVRRMDAKGSWVAGQMLRALALRMKQRHVSPLTPLHIAGEKNAMTDIPSRSFGSEKKWHCIDDSALLNIFNSSFPLPNQNSWTVFRLFSAISMLVISVLQMQAFAMDEWRRLPKPGKHIGPIGLPTANLFKWTLTYRGSHTPQESAYSRASLPACAGEDMARAERLRATQWRRRFRPLARRYRWPSK